MRSNTKSGPKVVKLLLTGVLSVVGCAPEGLDDDQRPNLAQSTLVARVDLAGSSLDFYEPEPGTLLEVETGRGDEPRPYEPPNLDPVQRFEFLTKTKAPAALVEAAVRAGNDGHSADPIPETGPIPKDSGAWVSRDWFIANYCTSSDRKYYQLTETENRSWSDRVEYMKAGVFLNTGYVRAKFNYSGSNIPDQWYGFDEFMYRGFRATSTINRAASVSVDSASATQNDLYDLCVNYHY